MDIVAKINDDNSFGGNFYTKDVKKDWNTTNVIYDAQYLSPIWNNSNWTEGATQEEIEDYNKTLVPDKARSLRFRVALINFGIMPSSIDAAIEAMPPGEQKERLFTLWNFADFLERADQNLIYMATQFQVTSEQLDAIFIATKQSI